MRVFVIESPNPVDMLQGRTEYQSLEKVCSLMGYEVASFLIKCKEEFCSCLRYMATIDDEDADGPLCIHLSAHGNKDGLAFGPDFVEWSELLETLQPLFSMTNFDGKVILVVSACGANQQKVTKEFNNKWKEMKKQALKPVKYLFVINEDTVYWKKAIVGWTILYYEIPLMDLDNKKSVMKTLDRMRQADFANVKYFRWDDIREKYLSYPKTAK